MSRKSSTDDYRFKSCMFCQNGPSRKHSLFTAGNLSVFPSRNLIACLARSAMALVCGTPFRFNLLLHFILLSYRLSLSQSDSESEKYGHFSGIELTLSFTNMTVPSPFTSSKRRLKRRSSPCRVSHRFLEYRICFLVMFTLRCSQ